MGSAYHARLTAVAFAARAGLSMIRESRSQPARQRVTSTQANAAGLGLGCCSDGGALLLYTAIIGTRWYVVKVFVFG